MNYLMRSKRKTYIYIILAVFILLTFVLFYRYRVIIGRIARPFLVAVVIAYLVNPMVANLESKKIPRRISTLLIYLIFSIMIAIIIIFFVPELINNMRELVNTLPNITLKYKDMFDGFISAIQSSEVSVDIKDVLLREINSGIIMVQNYIANLLKKSLTGLIELVTMLFDILLSMVIAYYFIKDAELFKSIALSLVPRRWRNGISGTGRDINSILSSFIQGQLIASLIVGIMEIIGLSIVNVKYPIILGIIGGLANVIPYFGPIIGAVPAVAVALTESPVKVIWVVLVFAIVQQIDSSFISPKIIEGGVGLHPVTTILVVLIGGGFFGIVGMLVSVPIAAILKVVAKRAINAIV